MRKLFVFMSCILAVLAVSCKKDKLTVEFNLKTDKIEIPAEGGQGKISYELVNPIDGNTVSAKCEDGTDWITDFNYSVDGEISFTVAANEAEQAREATVKVQYYDIERSFVVIQAAGEAPQPELSFEIIVKEVLEDAVTVDVIPSDKQVTYVSMLIEAEIFDSYGSDEEYFQQFELEYFKDEAEDDGISLKEYLEKHCLDSGDLKDIYVGGLDPETDYYFYAFGMTSDAVRTSDIYKVKFTTKAHEVITPEFEITFSDITSRSAVMTVKVTPESATYHFDIMRGSLTSEEILTYYREEIATLIENGSCTDAVEYWGELDRGEVSYTYDGNLLPNTLYTGFAFGVDETTGEFTSEAKLVEFTTLDEGGDEITLEIKAEKYFIVNDLIALYPDDTELAKNKGKYMVPVELVTTGEPDKVYSTYWTSDWSQESGENIITTLSGDIAGGWSYEGNNVRMFMSGGPRSILAAAESEGELVAPAAVYLGSMNDDEASPASEYVPAGAPMKASILRSRLLEKANADVSNTHHRIRTSK